MIGTAVRCPRREILVVVGQSNLVGNDHTHALEVVLGLSLQLGYEFFLLLTLRSNNVCRSTKAPTPPRKKHMHTDTETDQQMYTKIRTDQITRRPGANSELEF